MVETTKTAMSNCALAAATPSVTPFAPDQSWSKYWCLGSLTSTVAAPFGEKFMSLPRYFCADSLVKAPQRVFLPV